MQKILMKPKLPKHHQMKYNNRDKISTILNYEKVQYDLSIKKQRRFLIFEIYKKNELSLFYYSNTFTLDDLYDISKYFMNCNTIDDIVNKIIKLSNNNKIIIENINNNELILNILINNEIIKINLKRKEFIFHSNHYEKLVNYINFQKEQIINELMDNNNCILSNNNLSNILKEKTELDIFKNVKEKS